MGRMRMAAVGVALAALAGTAGCAGMREDMGMSSEKMDGGMQMSEADKQMMASCMAMTSEQIMQNKKCQDMAKMHQEMMNKGMTPPT